MGVGIDPDADGQPDVNALGDDNDGNDDEDGVFFSYPIFAQPMGIGQVDVNMTWSPYGGNLSAWIDFNIDGDWDDAGEQIFTDYYLVSGMMHYGLTFTIPTDVVAGETFARFRISTENGLGTTGAAIDGEVEDYKITIEAYMT